MHRFAVLTLVVTVALASWSVVSGSPKLPAENDQAGAELKQLKEKRVEILATYLRAAKELSRHRERIDSGGLQIVIEATDELAAAELALAEDRDEKIRILSKNVETHRAFEQVLKARQESGLTVLKAEANRLAAEIRLAEAQQ